MGSVSGKTVVVVEDHLATQRLIRVVLDRVELNLVFAATGLQGLEAIEAHHPDLVVLDLRLPDIDGWEILAWIRHRHEPRDLPVLILTADGGEPDETRARDGGADGYIHKPFDPVDLRQTVTRLLGGCLAY